LFGFRVKAWERMPRPKTFTLLTKESEMVDLNSPLEELEVGVSVRTEAPGVFMSDVALEGVESSYVVSSRGRGGGRELIFEAGGGLAMLK
jgi:hypothetical protein